MRVVFAFASPLGLGLFELEKSIRRRALQDASSIPFVDGQIRVQKHDEARNFRAVVAPFGHLVQWFEGPNKSRVLVRCLVLTFERVPRSVVVSQGSLLGGNGRSWVMEPIPLLSSTGLLSPACRSTKHSHGYGNQGAPHELNSSPGYSWWII